MLDLRSISVVDNHCHPILKQQRIDIGQFRRYFTEASDSILAEQHVPNSVYYLWLIRQVASLYDCEPREEAVISARNHLSSDALLEKLVQAANIEALVLDFAYPPPQVCYSPEDISRVGRCRTAKMLRLEVVMQELVLAHNDFDEVLARFTAAISDARAKGYCAFKSIVAYRTGLEIAEWSRDEAIASFQEARTQVERQGFLRISHKPLIDYLLHKAFQQAAEQSLPIQFHTGYGDSDTDMRLGNPLHLRAVLERTDYRSMQVVLLHESYPYSQLGAYLAAVYPHVYFDLSYTIPFVDRFEMLAFTRQALGVAPASKLVYSSDGIHVPEMYWAAAMRGRSVLTQVLQEMIDADEIDQEQAEQMARMILHGNALMLYRL